MFPQDDSALIAAELEPAPQSAIHHAAVVRALAGRRRVLDHALARLALGAGGLAEVAARLVETLEHGGTVLVAGNGGSAAEAQHFAAELVGRFKRDRAPYPVLALTTDTAILTAVANDYGYADVFARQVRAFGQPGDLFLGFSTSGESENLVRALAAARERGRAHLAAIDGPLAFYGANAYSQALLGLYPDIKGIGGMFDDTSAYAGHVAYGPTIDIAIEQPTAARLRDFGAIVISAYLHDAEIVRKLHGFGFTGPVFTARSDTAMAIRSLSR